MHKLVRGLLALGLLAGLALSAAAQDDGMVENPKYKFWASFKPNSTSTYHEVTTFSGPEKESLPGGKDEKTIVYRLLSANKDKVVVQTTVIEEEFLGTIESAPTKATYPAKIKKANLEAVLEEFGAKKAEEETVKVGKEEIKCKVLAGTTKTKGGGTVDYKLYYADTVPGGIVKRTRTTREGDRTVAETVITLRSYAMPKAKKEKEKAKDAK